MRIRFPHSRTSIIRFALMTIMAVSLGEARASMEPLSVTLHPSTTVSAQPTWAGGAAPIVSPEASSVLFSLPSLALEEEIGCLVLTTVFDDRGDGGPLVEWIAPSGEKTLLSAGLGEVGVAPGPNVRTLLIPLSLALDGGKVRVSFAGRFERLLTVALRPAKELTLASLAPDPYPALIDGAGNVLTREEVSGKDSKSAGGDRTEGRLVRADLGTQPIRIDLPGTGDSTEYVVPVSANPAGCLLEAEIAGLDPESWIGVSLNGESRGALAPAPLSLNDPGVLLDHGRIRLAGWRKSSLFLPGRLWKEGENSLILTLHRGQGDIASPVLLRNVACDMLFRPPSPETLSTGSLFGNPPPQLFHTGNPQPLPIAP